MKILNDIACKLNSIQFNSKKLIEFKYIKCKLNLAKFNQTIGLKFHWKKMGWKLVDKIFKIFL
jgi:hypothetical protein